MEPLAVPQLEKQIIERGRGLFDLMGEEAPSVFNTGWWVGKALDWCMRNEDFKVQLFRFIDVLPYLRSASSLSRHLEEYFGRGEGVPRMLRWGVKGAGLGGRLTMRLAGATVRKNLEMMARHFIAGENPARALRTVERLRQEGFAATLDLLGEATISEKEADDYAARYLELLDALAAAQADWPALGGDKLDWGHAPRIDVSLKPSALYSQADPLDFDGSVEGILERLVPICRRVVEVGGSLCIDMEMRSLKNITLEVYRRLRSQPEFRNYPHLGIAIQTYLRETAADLDALLAWAREERLPLSVRLVKGAYWDYEQVIASQRCWPPPVFTRKAHTDAAFERAAEKLLRNHDLCHLACASHNVRSVAAVFEMARALGVPEERLEFQALYGMAEPFRKALLRAGARVRVYCPVGELVPGMAYLIRRLLENTSNESFLRLSFVEGVERDRLLARPEAPNESSPSPRRSADLTAPFANEPFPDWSLGETRAAYARAIEAVRERLGRDYPLLIGGREVRTAQVADSLNPARPSEVVGRVCQASAREAEEAVEAARDAFPAWRDTPPAERAQLLLRAAELARERLFDLSAWQTLEAGKQWNEAYLDVAEAIDYLEYYAREMVRLATPRQTGKALGEVNHYFYQPRGVAAVIAPWNFPLAISCGMASAALVAGNCVVYKPSSLTPVVGHTLCSLFRDAGVPAGVFNYVPGSSREIGDVLVGHPAIALIAFTGSKETGLAIIERASRLANGQHHVKKVIAEMGGKNAIIIDDDADLDEAVPAVIRSAFGYQGQKCSACSRAIVLDEIYDRFMERLVEAARSVKIGPAEDPANFMGPVISQDARDHILGYLELARSEGRIVYSSPVPEEGYYVPLTIVADVGPEARIAQEEIFGPVLAVMRAGDFDEAIALANSTDFALTGAVFSRSPDHLERARREFRVGNLYLNRGCTGAIVGRQPFGGFKLSGIGSKAGGPDYLLQFLEPRTVTENTMRRGFIPSWE